MRYELGLAASIMALFYCFQMVSVNGDRNMFWLLLFYHFATMVLFMGARRVVGWGKIKFFSADNAWISFCLSFLGVPVAVILWGLIIRLFI